MNKYKLFINIIETVSFTIGFILNPLITGIILISYSIGFIVGKVY